MTGVQTCALPISPRSHAYQAGQCHPQAFCAEYLRYPARLGDGDYIAEAVEKIRQQVGDEEVILGLSGGVDSSVAAALIHHAIGDQLTCVFVDHGLLRLNEGDMVMDMFVGKLHAKVIRVDAADQFLGHLAGVSEPEAKRKIIGREFVEVFKAEAAKLKAANASSKGAAEVRSVKGADRKSTRLNSSHPRLSRMPSSA